MQRRLIKKGLVFLAIFTVLGTTNLLQAACDCVSEPKELKDRFVKLSFIQNFYAGASLDQLEFNYPNSKYTCWQVYSDRAANQLYASPNGLALGEQDTLAFMEKVQVREVSGSWIKVGTYTIEKSLEKCDERVGWIKATKMVLNSRALLNENGITKKGLVLLTLEKESITQLKRQLDNDNLEDLKVYNFYKNPETRLKDKKTTEPAFSIYYVIKETSGAVLLSQIDKLNNNTGDLSQSVKGWIKKIHVTDWDNKVSLEPTYGPYYTAAYKNNVLPVFHKLADLNSFLRLNQPPADDSDIAPQFWSVGTKREPREVMRMPILNHLDGEIKKVATVGYLGADKKIRKELDEKLIVKKEEIRKEKSELNILYVIDATKSLDDFQQSIIQSIERIIDIQKVQYADNNIRFALAVYRDYDDGEKVFDYLPLSTPEKVKKKLGEIDFNSIAKPKYEAQYQGLINGIEKCGFSSNQSNIVVLVGDCGNYTVDPKGYTAAKVINALNKYEASLITFQVNSEPHGAYINFNLDAMTYLKGMAEASEFTKDAKNSKRLLKASVVTDESEKNTRRVQYLIPETGEAIVNNAAPFGKMIYADLNTDMPLSELERGISASINDYLDRVKALIRDVDNISKDLKRKESSLKGKAAVIKKNNIRIMLENSGFTKRDINTVINNAEGLSFTGYVNMSYYGNDAAAFRKVVFLSDAELDLLLEKLSKVQLNNASASEQRKHLYKALLELAKKAAGENSDENLKNRTLNDIWQILFGVPFREGSELANLPLSSLSNSNSPELEEFIRDFNDGVNEFNKTNLEQHRFSLNGKAYYWIPLTDFPGYE